MENHKQQQQGIIPSQRSQLARDCLVWGIRLVCGPATVRQITKQMVLPVAARSTVYFVFFDLMYDMQVPN